MSGSNQNLSLPPLRLEEVRLLRTVSAGPWGWLVEASLRETQTAGHPAQIALIVLPGALGDAEEGQEGRGAQTEVLCERWLTEAPTCVTESDPDLVAHGRGTLAEAQHRDVLYGVWEVGDGYSLADFAHQPSGVPFGLLVPLAEQLKNRVGQHGNLAPETIWVRGGGEACVIAASVGESPGSVPEVFPSHWLGRHLSDALGLGMTALRLRIGRWPAQSRRAGRTLPKYSPDAALRRYLDGATPDVASRLRRALYSPLPTALCPSAGSLWDHFYFRLLGLVVRDDRLTRAREPLTWSELIHWLTRLEALELEDARRRFEPAEAAWLPAGGISFDNTSTVEAPLPPRHQPVPSVSRADDASIPEASGERFGASVPKARPKDISVPKASGEQPGASVPPEVLSAPVPKPPKPTAKRAQTVPNVSVPDGTDPSPAHSNPNASKAPSPPKAPSSTKSKPVPRSVTDSSSSDEKPPATLSAAEAKREEVKRTLAASKGREKLLSHSANLSDMRRRAGFGPGKIAPRGAAPSPMSNPRLSRKSHDSGAIGSMLDAPSRGAAPGSPNKKARPSAPPPKKGTPIPGVKKPPKK